jgi:hypothetical protein
MKTLLIGDNQQRLEMPQHLVGAPFFAQLDRGALEISVILLELAFKSRQQRKGIGGGAAKPARI